MRKNFALMAICLLASACVQAKNSIPLAELKESPSLPVMAWDHRPEAEVWTRATLAAVARHDAVLAGRVPEDIGAWCPAYEKAGMADRRAFWAGLISTVGRYESSWNPGAVGGGGRYVGVMQISPKSARNYGCDAASASGLKDGAANLACAVDILAHQVDRDGMVAGAKGNRGIGRDWMPLRKADKRQAMAAWTRGQAYCGGGAG